MIFIFVLLFILSWLIDGITLYGIEWLFKLESPSIKKSLRIVLIYSVIGFFAWATPYVIWLAGFLFPLPLAGIIFGLYYIFKYSINRHYPIGGVKKIFIIFEIFSRILFYLMFYFLIHPFVGLHIVPNDSMKPKINEGNLLLVDRVNRSYYRNDIVLYKGLGEDYSSARRVVGVPGDNIEIKNGIIYINGNPLSGIYSLLGIRQESKQQTLGDNQYFVFRDNSQPFYTDSNHYGPIQKENIIGKVYKVELLQFKTIQ